MKRLLQYPKRDFNDREFAIRYIKKHEKMAEKLGRKVSKRLTALGFQSGKILDAGCGFGVTDILLSHYFPESEITGIDLSKTLLQHADMLLQKSNVENRVKFKRADVHKIPFENNTFNAVLSINMVHLVDNPVKMFNEIERVLHPGGYLLVIDIRRSLVGIIEKEFKTAITLDEARELFTQTNIMNGTFSQDFLYWEFYTITPLE